MQLPTDLQHFPNGALIVASDSIKASFLLLGGDGLEELDGIEMPRERSSDSEGPFVFDENDESRLHAFVHGIVERIEGLLRDHSVTHIHLVMPAEIEHAVSSHLSQDARAARKATIHVDAMNEAPLEIVKRVVAELGHA